MPIDHALDMYRVSNVLCEGIPAGGMGGMIEPNQERNIIVNTIYKIRIVNQMDGLIGVIARKRIGETHAFLAIATINKRVLIPIPLPLIGQIFCIKVIPNLGELTFRLETSYIRPSNQ